MSDLPDPDYPGSMRVLTHAELISALAAEGLIVGILPTLDCKFTRIVTDHRVVKPGDLFVAIQGTQFDGHTKIADALASGAESVMSEKPFPTQHLESSKIVQVKDTRLALAIASAAFQQFPTRVLEVIGVTGTSGKTTTTLLIDSILGASGRKTGVIGTIEIRVGERVLNATHTTPGPIELQAILRTMKDEGCDSVIMEVSSHALKQHRVSGIAFDVVGFLNLSPEHLDFHPDMQDYLFSKRMLFQDEWIRSERLSGTTPSGVIAVNGEEGQRLYDSLDPKIQSHCKTVKLPQDLQVSGDGIHGTFSGVAIQSPLMGSFNAENISVAVAIAQALGVDSKLIAQTLNADVSVAGRLEKIADPSGGRRILVDYAHKPDALEKVLSMLKNMLGPDERLITVFGCGGDRDPTKRPLMGAIAERLSDVVVITSDNPRSEDPLKIIEAIRSGLKFPDQVMIEADRKRAIEKAISIANRGDFVLIAGKGHETYQILGPVTVPFDDREIAREFVQQG
ncbi:MAG: UDP-N-acetylmuramoyl-L-alanyl-D-glutamate--2,6-diaminopimelate ligase [Proteobacteria bacterium]|nr:MAG: UDP-N-acetylmuramoyl-L-alanyl-D-glutamate--2,6-diaminopimelate ligase [Pseudomonadota bacterium]